MKATRKFWLLMSKDENKILNGQRLFWYETFCNLIRLIFGFRVGKSVVCSYNHFRIVSISYNLQINFIPPTFLQHISTKNYPLAPSQNINLFLSPSFTPRDINICTGHRLTGVWMILFLAHLRAIFFTTTVNKVGLLYSCKLQAGRFFP